MDGREALDLFESEEPDLVLLDQMLPEVEGTEVLRQIRTR
ncbi:MAG: response regulator, partial [Spirochaetales bacterium]|nr:response regulator [Spirochaetales bacterium]